MTATPPLGPDGELRAALADRYRMERELGRGGMATVYLAQDLRHDRPVALKVLHAELASALGPERFQREIRLAARLQHPHILTVHDSGESAGRLWFTMPFVEGESVRDRLRREKQLPVEDAVRIAREAAQGLEYAHRHGVIHRDVKPENLLLTEDGNTMVADFGIARSLAGESDKVTRTGLSIGTAAYMSPEQAAGESDLDPRSDVYSLAIVLYEMLAGETPFAAATPQAMVAQRFTKTPLPLRELRESVPEHVERAVQTALARTVADRFASAAEFARALGAVPVTASYAPAPAVGSAAGSGATVPAAPASAATAHPATGTPATPTRPLPRVLRGVARRPLFAALMLGFALGLGVLFAWFGTRPEAADGAPAIAVLPFENVGSADDAYFADGVTDAVRGKLTDLPGVAVIARSSSEEYRKTTKSPRQIAQELGVRYLLTGTVRWAKEADGTSRVQVRPELVEIASDGQPRSRWQQPFDAPLTDVFAVQGDIAGRVARALDVTLTPHDRQQLAERPTQNLAAYDLYLKGEAAVLNRDAQGIKRGIQYFQQAVALDSSFALAWSRLAAFLVLDYLSAETGKPPLASIDSALARSVALAPRDVDTYRARIVYASVLRRNPAEGLAIATEGLTHHPGNPDLLRQRGSLEVQLGQREQGIATMRRAVTLDPRSPTSLQALAQLLSLTRQHEESRELYRRALAITPGNMSTLQGLIFTHLAQGDLAAARRVLDEAPREMDRAQLLAYNSMYQDMYWLLTPAQQDTVLGLPTRYFLDDPATRALAFAQILHQRGDSEGTRGWADSVRAGYGAAIRESGADVNPQLPGLMGVALAYQGRFAEAVASGQQGLRLAAGDEELADYLRHLLIRIHLLAGEHDKALDLLEPLLARPYLLTPGWLRVDPAFAPLRGNPRFERLAARG